jgi:hypothetical protein
MTLYTDSEDGSSLSSEGEQWNALLQMWESVRDAYELTDDVVEPVVSWVEGSWYEPDPDHTMDVVRRNLYITGVLRMKDAVTAGMRAKRVPDEYRETSNLGWDEIPGWIEWLGGLGFTTAVVDRDAALSGGHGTGVFWSVTGNVSGVTYTGTVPDSTHGRNDGALKAQRGMVRQCIDLHDSEIEQAIGQIAWPSV